MISFPFVNVYVLHKVNRMSFSEAAKTVSFFNFAKPLSWLLREIKYSFDVVL